MPPLSPPPWRRRRPWRDLRSASFRATMTQMRILVADDERAVRDSLRRALELEGYEIELAADGEEALERIHAEEPEAVILDVLMPRLDGLEVCRRVRKGGTGL